MKAPFPTRGEMAEHMAALDWSQTPLGPPPQWPQSLSTAVRIILASRYPMFVWWGKELVNLYNDAYAPMLGERHPAALGKPAKEVWADVWPVVGPQTELVLQSGRSTWNEETLLIMSRHGYTEETYFTFSYSPAPNDDGSIGGVFCAVTEDTARVLSRRRVRCLRDLGAQLVGAKSAAEVCELTAKVLGSDPHDVPFALLYLVSDDSRRATLAGYAGIQPGLPASPRDVSLEGTLAHHGQWPFRVIPAEGLYLTDLQARFGKLPGGPWPEPTAAAMLLPIAHPDQAEPVALLIAGVSPRRQLDDDYRGFFGLLAGQLGAGISDARAYEAQQQKAEALAELDRAKTAFFSNVSHEFRTPLTLMLGPLEDLLGQPLTEAARPQIELAHRNSLRLLKLVNTLLDFARMEAARLQVVYEPTDLAAATADLASAFRSAIEKAGIRLVVDCQPLPEPVCVDRGMWEKIVLNLLSNALKYTLEGEITVSLRWLDGQVELAVRDTGTGIPQQELPHVFDRFHRVPNPRARTQEGTGIGLALVKELVSCHRGSITVASVLAEGTTFTVRIPTRGAPLPPERTLAATQALPALGAKPFVEEAVRWVPEAAHLEDATLLASHPEPTPAASPLAAAEGGSGRPRLLIVDDNADMRGYLARLLRERYDVETLPDGEAALGAARARRPDLILSDVMMPRLDGFALVRELRADSGLKTIPVILLSARAGEESLAEGLQQGADDYLIKPFSARELTARVTAHLQMARLRKEVAEQVRQTEDRYRTLFNTLIEGFCIIEMLFDAAGKPVDYRFLETNPAFEKQTGLRNAQGKLMRDLVPGHEAHWFETYGRIALSGQPERFINEARALNRWYEVCAFRVGGTESRKVGILFNDITERKRAQDEIFAANQRLEALMRALPVGVSFTHDAACQRITGNPTVLAQFEVAAQDNLSASAPDAEAAGRQIRFFQHGRPVTDAELPLQRAVAENRSIPPTELEVRLPSGKRWFADASGAPILDASGRVAGGVAVTVDITKRKQAEEALRESESRLRMAKAAAQLGIHDWDVTSGIVQWDERTRALWGVGPDASITYELFKAGLHPEDRAPTQAAVDRALDPKGDGSYYAEFRVVNAEDGLTRWIAATGQVTFVGGRPLRLVGTVQDISQRKEFQDALERLVAERTSSLQETTDQLNAFCYAVAHDLKAPIRAQVSLADLLIEDFVARLGAEGIDYLARMRDAAERQGRLVNDLLSHMSLNRADVPLEPLDLAPAVQAACADLQSEIHGLQALVHTESVHGMVLANGASLHLVLIHLVSNALKFVNPGTRPEVSLWTEVQSDKLRGSFVRLWVKDNGIGIPARSLEKVFGVFERLHPREMYPGTGMGLALVKRAVERMGGRVGVESEPGKGSRFWAELQAAAPAPALR